MFRNFQMVSMVVFGRGCFNQLGDILALKRKENPTGMVFFVDDEFEHSGFASRLPAETNDQVIWVHVKDYEPTTEQVDDLTAQVKDVLGENPTGVVGIGGGSVMDIAKAVSVMAKNPGGSADYQGWDIPKNPSLYHVGIPTLSGTGAEVSRTAVLTGPVRKLGINSDYSVFHQIVLDPELIAGAPKNQRFFTGMDCYIHCVESLEGTFLNTFSKAYGDKALDLCQDVFLGDDPEGADDKLMMASYCGGMSIAYSQVGVCHALSYGLAYVAHVRHGIGNSIVFNHLEDYYPAGVEEFKKMVQTHNIDMPTGVTKDLSEAQFEKMIDVALSLDPLWENALGKEWKTIMTRDKARELYERM